MFQLRTGFHYIPVITNYHLFNCILNQYELYVEEVLISDQVNLFILKQEH